VNTEQVTASNAPRLAVFHDGNSVSMFQFYEVARDLCRIVWVIGWSPINFPLKPLSRFGDVVDVSGMNEAQSVEHLMGNGLDGVIVFSDAPLRLAAAVADRLNLPFHSPDTARLLTDKLAQRDALGIAGLPGPSFAAVQTDDFNVNVPFPAVLKPRAGAGGRDTFIVKNQSELSSFLAGCEPTEQFILEEWLPDRTAQTDLAADVVSVESIARNGEIEHIMVTGRFPFAPPFRETGSFLPSDLSPTDWNSVTSLAAAAAKALRVEHGILHTEIKMTPTGPRIVEINGRLGGQIGQLISRIGGPSLFTWAIKLALGLEVGPVPELAKSPIAFFRMIVAPQSATRLEAVEGVKELSSLPGVEEILVGVQPGDTVDFHHSSYREHALMISGMVESHAELTHLIHSEIETTLHLTWSHD
jgi:biotin carboxylase